MRNLRLAFAEHLVPADTIEITLPAAHWQAISQAVIREADATLGPARLDIEGVKILVRYE